MTIDLSPIHLSGDDAKVVRAIQRHPRLQALLPAGIEPLVKGYVTSQATVAAVGKLTVEAPDFGALLAKDLEAGKQPDAAELVETYAASQRRSEEVAAVARQVGMLPHKYRAEVIREVLAAAGTMYDDLADQLDELLDRATPVVRALDGINNTDQAMDARREDDWRALKALSAELAELRGAHLDLCRAEDANNYPPGSPNVVLASFGGAEVAFPGLAELIDKGLGAFRNADLGWPAADPRDPVHLLTVVRQRNLLQPIVARPAEVSERRSALYAEMTDEGLAAPRAREAVDWSSPTSIAGVTWAPKPDPRR